MKKNILFLLALLAFQSLFAQKPFKVSAKLNPYTLGTSRYGLVLEVPLNKDFALTYEGRYLKKDWNIQGGEIFRTLKPAKGWGSIIGLRYYLYDFGGKNNSRFFVEPQYRYRKSTFDSAVPNIFTVHKVNEATGMIGFQWIFESRFLLDVGTGLGRINISSYNNIDNIQSVQRFLNVKLDIHLGYPF